jgi:DNA-directed RNA polymerase subunit RPC12/RpoP
VAEYRDPQPSDTVLTILSVAAAGATVVVAGLFTRYIGFTGFAAITILAVFLLVRWMAASWGYRCPNCGELFELSFLGQFTAVNMGNERIVRCPRCGKRSPARILRKIS